MKRRNGVMLVAIAAASAAIYFTPYGCHFIGGRSGSDKCYTKLCHYTGDCGGPWVQTAIPCDEVKLGESEAAVHFYFGNPDKTEGSRSFWSTGKPDPATIEARFEDGTLTELKCP